MEKSLHDICKGKSCLPDLLGFRKVPVSTQIKSIEHNTAEFSKRLWQYCTPVVTEEPNLKAC